jgi:hypothetical protein
MADTLAYGQYLTLRNRDQTQGYNFQNYWVNESAPFFDTSTGQEYTYEFLPFAFSGMVVTKSGDNQPATLVFPNNSLSRGWAETAAIEGWIANVRTVIVDPDSKANYTLLMRYIAQVVSASWDSTAMQLQMASVLDAAGADVPRKKLTQQLVGHLPLTSNVRVA